MLSKTIIFSKKTFTLIEMLIVVVIIGILAAALVPRLQSTQWRARDSIRKKDTQTAITALTMYYTDNQNYPIITCSDDPDPNPNCSYYPVQQSNYVKSWWLYQVVPAYLSKSLNDPLPDNYYSFFTNTTERTARDVWYIAYMCKFPVPTTTAKWGQWRNTRDLISTIPYYGFFSEQKHLNQQKIL